MEIRSGEMNRLGNAEVKHRFAEKAGHWEMMGDVVKSAEKD